MRSETRMTQSLTESTQSWASATLQGCGVPHSTCRTVGLGATHPSLSQCALDTNHIPEVPTCSTCPCSFTSVVAPNTLQSLDDGGRRKVRIGHRIPVISRVQHVIRKIHCALQQSIERDKERTINIMNLIVSDKQRWNFVTTLSPNLAPIMFQYLNIKLVLLLALRCESVCNFVELPDVMFSSGIGVKTDFLFT